MKHLLERRGGGYLLPPAPKSPLKHANKSPSLKTKPCATSFTNQTAPSTNQPEGPGGSGVAQVQQCVWMQVAAAMQRPPVSVIIHGLLNYEYVPTVSAHIARMSEKC